MVLVQVVAEPKLGCHGRAIMHDAGQVRGVFRQAVRMAAIYQIGSLEKRMALLRHEFPIGAAAFGVGLFQPPRIGLLVIDGKIHPLLSLAMFGCQEFTRIFLMGADIVDELIDQPRFDRIAQDRPALLDKVPQIEPFCRVDRPIAGQGAQMFRRIEASRP